VDEVDDDGDVELTGAGFGVDPVDLMVVPVDQGDPGVFVFRVPAG
jgi:hypothetical protein